MILQVFLIPIIIIPLCIGKTHECHRRNTSCNDIKSDRYADGFKFSYVCPEGSEISVSENETVIAHAVPGKPVHCSADKVMNMDNISVITIGCQDLQVKCIFPYGGRNVNETCFSYITEKLKNLDPSPTWGLIIGVIVLIVLMVVIGMLCWCYKKFKEQQGAATVCQFRRTSSCLKGTSQAETGETRHHEGSDIQEVPAVIRMSKIPSATYTCGSDENDTEEDNTLGSVLVHSIDPKADGKTPQSPSLGCNLSNEGIQLPKNEDTGTPGANSDSNHRAMHRNLRDDPGGVNDNTGKDIVRIRERPNGWTLGDRGPEDHEGQPLLSNQGAAFPDFDKTSEAALVNKCGFDPDQVSRCSTAPDTDVESTPNTKN